MKLEANSKLSTIVTEMFLRGIKRNISLAVLSQSYFKVGKTIRLSIMHYFIMKRQQIALSHSFDVKLRKIEEMMQPYYQIIMDYNPFTFRKDLL